MADKFTIEIHRENMRRIIRPRPVGSVAASLKQAVQKRKKPLGIR